MLRIFRHYVSSRVMVLLGMEGGLIGISLFVAQSVGLGLSEPSLPQALVLSLLILLTLYLAQLYDADRFYGRRELLLRLTLAFAGAYLLMAALGYLITPLRLPRIPYLLSFLVALPVIFLVRIADHHLMRNARRQRRVLLLGSGRPARIIAETVNGANPKYEMVGCLDGHPARIGQAVNGVKILGSMGDLAHISTAMRPSVIVVAMTEQRGSFPLSTILECKFEGIEVEEWPSFYEKLTGKIVLTDLRPSWLVFSDGFRKRPLTLAMKRGMDMLLASVGLLFALPLFPLIAILVKVDSWGPVLLRQERVGQHGRIFSLLKFRSMRADAEQHSGPVWAQERDPRVTRVGRILRMTRLDEIPQLWNVLRGEMSLVGPRPERPGFVAQLQERIPFYAHRLSVKPGITGWAQVKYRYAATLEDASEKLQYDLYYIKNVSIFLDLLILLHTLQVVLLMNGSR
ncbi:MAG: TIGR03013 family PEP-CTERM/XrtA system glycosyltransferase [candidate division NC10 bacterium]|nr:TIGR03013 family PEP-CTERM/XrtA system glycosyltransferase [candidate division NC10 bacterium]